MACNCPSDYIADATGDCTVRSADQAAMLYAELLFAWPYPGGVLCQAELASALITELAAEALVSSGRISQLLLSGSETDTVVRFVVLPPPSLTETTADGAAVALEAAISARTLLLPKIECVGGLTQNTVALAQYMSTTPPTVSTTVITTTTSADTTIPTVPPTTTTAPLPTTVNTQNSTVSPDIPPEVGTVASAWDTSDTEILLIAVLATVVVVLASLIALQRRATRKLDQLPSGTATGRQDWWASATDPTLNMVGGVQSPGSVAPDRRSAPGSPEYLFWNI